MSSTVTILVLDPQPLSAVKKALDAPDRLVVVVQTPSLARHALGTMHIALWICDLQTPDLDVKSLVSIAQYASPGIQVLFTGTKLMAMRADKLIEQGLGVGFLARPHSTFDIRKAAADAIAAFAKGSGGRQGRPPVSDAAPTRRILDKGVLRTESRNPAMGGVDPERYTLLDLIGIGGTGSVFLAMDKLLNIEVAIKLVNQDLLEDDDVLASLKDEARIAMQLSHQGILRTYSFDSYNNNYYIVMELVRGQTLRDVIIENERLSVSTTCDVLAACAFALDYAHAKNVIHNDLKPENIFITESSELKIIDFGTATLKNRAKALSHIIGTPEYMSPEQLRGEICGPETDVYALAIITYLMLVGRFPFPIDTTTEQLLEGLQPDFDILPSPLDDVLRRAAAFDPAQRYGSVGEFVKEFLGVCGRDIAAIDVSQPIVVRSGVPESEEPGLAAT
ncbi:MAG: serine/threonine-protein kinase [Kiritimatiellia bacterium]|jgi:predicted Ser/Thr protein kinase